jgi:hypothetical protein
VRIDPVAGRRLDATDDRRQADVRHVDGPSASGAQHVVMVDGRLAGDVGVGAGREVDALDQSQPGQQLERAEDGRSADAAASPLGGVEHVLGGEVSLLLVDRLRHGASGIGQAQLGLAERGDDGTLIRQGRSMVVGAGGDPVTRS